MNPNKQLSQSTILSLPNHFDDITSAVDSLAPAGSQIINIFEHKNPTGKQIGIFIDDINYVREIVKTKKENQNLIVVFFDATKMNARSQNALLKLLEEPRENLYFILATSAPESLLTTVRSRCQVISLHGANVSLKLPEDKAGRIKFMAAGNHHLANKLASDERFYNQQKKTFTLAKTFITDTPLQQMAVIKTVTKSSASANARDNVLDLINASLVLCRFLLKQAYNHQIADKSRKLLAADQYIRANGNARLALLACVV